MKKILLYASALSLACSVFAENLVDIESPEFGAAVRQYLLDNPEVILESVDLYNTNQAKLAEEEAKGAMSSLMPELLDEKTSFEFGAPDAKITIVEFIDYNCGYCRKAHEAVNAIVSKNPDVKVIFRQLPILSQGSLETAQVVMQINTLFGAQKALEFHNAAYAHQGQLDKTVALELMTSLGLDTSKIDGAFTDKTILGDIARLQEIAKILKFEGTPGFIIGDQLIHGYIEEEGMQALIDKLRV